MIDKQEKKRGDGVPEEGWKGGKNSQSTRTFD